MVLFSSFLGDLKPMIFFFFILGGPLSLVGHSAGGWLARLYMEEFGMSDISLLLTLGTPHQ
jgi:alpha-beta hydrolase superfamily lysophospholipase